MAARLAAEERARELEEKLRAAGLLRPNLNEQRHFTTSFQNKN
jgi:hypothetical protein